MSTYTISITEAQRAIMLTAIAAMHGDAPAQFDQTDADEPLALRDMLNSLPRDEAEMIHVHGCRPGQAVHGFAL